MPNEKSHSQKEYHIISLHAVSKVVKFIESKSGMVIARDQREGERGTTNQWV